MEEKLHFEKAGGIIPAIVQDYKTNEILMLAYVNEEAWSKTLDTGHAHYYSRSRHKIWIKGEQSNHYQIIKEILVDCDRDTIIYRVEQMGGAACHKGYRSCFFRRLDNGSFQVKDERVFDPKEVYGK